jgi:hypothetical protein
MQIVLTDSLLLVSILDPVRSGRSAYSSNSDSSATPIANTFDSDSEVSDKVLVKNPLPPLQGRKEAIELETESDFELCNFGQGAGVDGLVGSPEKRQSSSKRGKKTKPSKQNQTKERKKESNDCRPDSDKDQFNRLHIAKEAQRAAERSSRAMAKVTKKTVSSDEENKKPDARRDDSSASRQSRAQKQAAEASPGKPKTHPLAHMPPEMQRRFTAELDEFLTKDKKLGTDKVRTALARARKTMLCLKYNNESLLEYKTEHAKQAFVIESLREKLQAKLQRSKARVMRESEGEKEKIAKIVNTELWRLLKFITCKDDENIAAEFVYKALYSEEDVDHDKLYSWSETYNRYIRDCLYAKRNYCASQLKACAWKLFENGQTIPTVEEIRMCIGRKNVVGNAADMALFKWFWETLLCKVVGAIEWGTSVRLYNKISTYKIPNDPKNRTLITASNEALICVLWENQREKWHELWAWSQIEANRGKKQVNRGGKFTSCEKGQCDYSGWSSEGIQAYNTYVKEATAGRKAPNRKLLETATLNELRAQYNIDQPDPATQARANRSRKRMKLPNNAPFVNPNAHVVRAVLEEEMDVSDGDE